MLLVNVGAASDDVEVALEHSLVSISKWEAKYKKSFFNQQPKTNEEGLDYIRMMCLDPSQVHLVDQMTTDNFVEINAYITDEQTATKFFDGGKKPPPRSETITSELVYYWLVQFKIPFEVQNWHFNRLMTLIRISGIKQSKPTKMNRQQAAEQFRKLNAERREKLGTSG